MKIYILLLVLIITSAQISFTQNDRRTDKSKLVVTTFNTYFMWDGIEPEEGRVDFPYKGDPQAAGEHMEDIASIIRNINPDIINLVEVEGLPALKRLNDEFLKGMDYKPYLVKGTDSYTGQDVGLLTRIDPKEDKILRYDAEGNSNGVLKSVSKNYYGKFDINGLKFALVSLHFLAIPSNTANIDSRQAQADAIRQISEQLDNEGYSLIILGDFNDYDGDVCCLDINDNRPITTVLRDIKQLNNSTNTDDLINVHQYLPKEDRYTAHWDRNDNNQMDGISEFSTIDHILIAPELIPLVKGVSIDHGYNPILVSDHFPVTVTFQFDDSQQEIASIRIVSLVPNPSGDENQNEKITLFNSSNSTVTIANWLIRDIAGNTWTITTTINANSKMEILRNGQKMALNNSGDRIELIDGNNKTIQTFSYGNAEEDEIIFVQ